MWDKLPNETQLAYEAFQMYLRFGVIKKVVQAVRSSESTVRRWKANHKWDDRLAAFNKHIDSTTIKGAQQIRDELNTDQALKNILIREIEIYHTYARVAEGVLKGVEEDERAPTASYLKLLDLHQKHSATMMRWLTSLQTGDETVEDDIDVTALSDEELELALELQQKVMGG